MFETNPKRLLTEDETGMLELWTWLDTGGMGARALPESGGYADQVAIVMDALRVMDRQRARLKDEAG